MTGTVNTEKIGKLGFGYMRLPRINGEFDYKQINKMADDFLSSGGTYFDAAYVYEGAEIAFRESVVKRHPRDSYTIATKLPIGLISDDMPAEKIFNTSLERLGVDYVDFYLLHGINSAGNTQAEEKGAWKFAADMKAQGKIRHVGFSFHGYCEDLDDILTKHPETEFVMLQINYFDWDREKMNARRLHEIGLKHNVPMVAMEPLFGGKLTSEDSPIAELLKKANKNVSLASWALRFVAQLEGVFVTLSGMSSHEQVTDNINTFKDIQPLSADEMATIDAAVKILRESPRIECTACNYCKDCPANINIIGLINLYNDHKIHKTTTNLAGTYNFLTNNRGKAHECTACGVCETACPQDLPIIETIANVAKLFG
jgi:predicted aldo/keto reductase-like oxidoreductase